MKAGSGKREAGSVLLRLAVLVALAVWPVSVPAQDRVQIDTITVEQRVLVGGDLTPTEAKRRAIEGALAEAVRQRVGLRVQSAQLSVLDEREGQVTDGYISVVQLDAAGRATDYRILGEQWVTTTHPSLGAQLYYQIRALVSVAHEIGAPDAGFHVTLSLNDGLFFDEGRGVENNGEVIATVTSTREAHVTIFSIADDSVQLLFPNAFVTDTKVGANVDAEFPPSEWRAQGVRLRASLPAGRASRRELLAVVATRVPVRFSSGSTLLDLQRWLVRIPLDQRAVAFAAFDVRRR